MICPWRSISSPVNFWISASDFPSTSCISIEAAAWLMQSGLDAWQAAGYLAMSTETLARTYGHHHSDYMRRAAEAIGRRPQNARVTG